MKKMKVFAISLAILLFLTTLWIYINSHDASDFDPHGLQISLAPLPDIQNALTHLAFTQEEGYTVIKDHKTFYAHFHGTAEEWDENFISKLMIRHGDLIAAMKKAAAAKALRIPMLDYSHQETTKSSTPIFRGGQVLIVLSRDHFENGDYWNSIILLAQVIRISEHLKHEENQGLLSYTLGAALEYYALVWASDMIRSDQLEDFHLVMLESTIDIIKSYPEDGFAKIFDSELRMTKSILDRMLNAWLPERIEEFLRVEKLSKKYVPDYKTEAYDLTKLLIPTYYIKPNLYYGQYASILAEAKEQAIRYCDNISLTGIQVDPQPEYTGWKQVLYPAKFPNTDMESYTQYFERRCLAHTYKAAIRTQIAFKRYELEYGYKPTSLEVVIPEFLKEVPVDYLNGGILKYSPDNQWLYSVGLNLKDDGGSHESHYQHKCQSDIACANNPTFPL